jgi:type I restriction enzyme S subunit
MSEYKKIKLGDFLSERKNKFEPEDKSLFEYKKIEKIDFANGKIFLSEYKPTKTKQIKVGIDDLVFSGLNIEKGAVAINDTGEVLVVSANYSTCEVDYSIVEKKYFSLLLKSPNFKKLLKDHLKKDYGFTRPKHLLPLEIDLPDINTQEIIANSLIKKQNIQSLLCFKNEQQHEYIASLRQAILQDAIQGKLTEDWRKQNPDVEPASELLKKIELVKGKLIKNKLLKAGAKTKNPLTVRDLKIPKSWFWAKGEEIFFVTKLAGFEYSKYVKLKSEGDVPVIRAQNVKPLRIDETNLLYLDLNISKILGRCALTKPCLLVTFIGAGIGDVCIFNKNERWHLAPNVAKMEYYDGCENMMNLKFLNYYLLSVSGQFEIFKHRKATAQPCLSMATIRDIDFPIPPIKEQKEIVKKVDELMKMVNDLEVQIKENKTTADLLIQSVLREAFSK